MEKIEIKLKNIHKMIVAIQKAIKALDKFVDSEYAEFFQDSVVGRYEILIESMWKNIKFHLENQEISDIPGSPKGVIHRAREIDFLSQEEHDEFVKYLSLRNLSSHLYDQPQYILVVTAAPQAVILIKKIVNRIESPLHL